MPATRADIERWLELAEANNATHLIVVCDTFDYDDYPVLIRVDPTVEDVLMDDNPDHWPVYLAPSAVQAYDKYNEKEMQRVVEVYDLSLDREEQLNEYRAFHL